MAFPQGPSAKPERARVPVFAIGRRVLACGGDRSGRVTLSDETGTASLGTLVKNTEVAIVAWRPRGEATKYLVRAMDSGVEGWVGVGSIRGKPAAPVPPRAPASPPAVRPLPASMRRPPQLSAAKARGRR